MCSYCQKHKNADTSVYILNRVYWEYKTTNLYKEFFVELDSMVNICLKNKPEKIEILVTEYSSASTSYYLASPRAEKIKLYFVQPGINANSIITRSDIINTELSFGSTINLFIVNCLRKQKK